MTISEISAAIHEASDRELAEIIIYTYKMWKADNTEIELTEDDIKTANVDEIAANFKKILEEIVNNY